MSIRDIFRISEFKKQIIHLKEANEALSKNNLELEQSKKEMLMNSTHLKSQIQTALQKNKELSEKASLKLSLHEAEPIKLDKIITLKTAKLSKLSEGEKKLQSTFQKIIATNKSEVKELKNEISQLIDQKENIRADISDLEPDLEMSSYGLYRPQYDFSTSLEYKDTLINLREQQKAMIKDKTAVTYNPNWIVNDSKAEGRKMTRNSIKSILRSFNNECTEAINKATYSNYDRISRRITRSFEQHNKMYSVDDVAIKIDYLNLKLDELNLAFAYRQKSQEEKEILREQRAQEREEKALQREIASKRKKIDKEIKHYTQAIQELEEKSKEEPSNQNLLAEIQKLKNELEAQQNQKTEVDYREQHATAGYVYIISNIGSFGRNIFKIGVTRRLEPMDRINELSSASVPFKFDVHALIFSEDAYKLESELHNKFTGNRVNKVNNRKEYFSITIGEVENELKKYKDMTVDFREKPEANEYRETLALENSIGNATHG